MEKSFPGFDASLKHLGEVLRSIRAGRASPALVEELDVEVYGNRMRLKELARISAPDPRTIQVEPWDKSQMKAVEKSLASADLGTSPVVAGMVIRCTLPPLTEERRRELTKLVHRHVEEAKVSIRHVREKLLRDLRTKKEAGEFSEDAFERERKTLQEEVAAATAAADTHGKTKEGELLSM